MNSSTTEKMMRVVGRVHDDAAVARIEKMLKDEGMKDIEVRTCPDFDYWLGGLPEEPVEGLVGECWRWIKYWGSNFGMETSIKKAILEVFSDSPQVLANAIFESTTSYSMHRFEASCLTMMLINESMKECAVAQKGERQ